MMTGKGCHARKRLSERLEASDGGLFAKKGGKPAEGILVRFSAISRDGPDGFSGHAG